MATTMRVKKGDIVHMLAGKDRGKQGRVLEARPAEGRVIVENLNIVKRHTKPRPMKDANRMGGTTIQPGGVIDKPAPIPISNVMVVCPVCNRPTRVGMTYKEIKGEQVKVRVCRRADCGQEIDGGDAQVSAKNGVRTAPQGHVRAGAPPAAQGGARRRLDHGGAARLEDHAQHGRRRGEDRREAARCGDGRADADRRPACAAPPCPHVDRRLQDPHGHAGRRRR